MTVLPITSATDWARHRTRPGRVDVLRAGLLVTTDLAAALVVVALLPWFDSASSAVLFVPAWIIGLLVVGEYRLPGSTSTRARRLFLVALVLPSTVLIAGDLLGMQWSATDPVAACLSAAALGCGARVIADAAVARGVALPGLRHRVVAVGGEAAVRRFVAHLQQGRAGRHFEVVAACLDEGPRPLGQLQTWETADAAEVVRQVGADAAVLLPDAGPDDGRVRRLRWQLEDAGITVYVSSGLTDVAAQRATIDLADGLLLLHVRRPQMGGLVRTLEHAAERVVAALALVVLAPFLLLLALLIRIDSEGPALFRQVRIGRDGTPFTLWKLRTMTTDAEAVRAALLDHDDGAGLLFKIRTDPRVTRVGGWLRRTSLDELPQLINVVRGEMSLVGPRPALPDEVQQYDEEVCRRLRVRPGITGLWQVSGRSDLSWSESVRLDQAYVDNWSLRLDLMILLSTVRAVLGRRGAY